MGLRGTFEILDKMRFWARLAGFWIVTARYSPELGSSVPVYTLAHIDANDLNSELQTMGDYTSFVNGQVTQIINNNVLNGNINSIE